ncbi:T-box transcription factor T homolog isoform X2 [Amphiura filiformis]|uniref:T-box transcription factor T homolog isoform X2 n=1 Tax=Amphiura filiformis TaxID=82378 RepID=UPI003B21AA04
MSVGTMRAPTYNITHLMNAVRSEMTEGSEKGDPSEQDLKVTLEDSDLWRRFNKLTNEMIVTKTGRRMFPVLSVCISGLNPNSMYSVLLDFAPADEHRWKYVNGEWAPGGKPDSPPPSTAYIHPDSPNFGAHWMKQSVGFSKVKLSNKLNGSGQIMLNSLHRYEPRIHIIRVGGQEKQRLIGSFSFSETQFIAVTAYQNEDITQLKIKYNPFAKAFLDIKEKTDHTDLLDDCHDQPRYPQLGGWFLPGTAGTLCAAAAAGGPNAHQFTSSYGLPPAASHGCERYSSLRSHRTSPYPPPPYQKYSSGTSYPESSSALSLQDSWSSLAASSSMSPHHTSIQSSCAQYNSYWPTTVSASSYSHVATASSSSPIPTSLVRTSEPTNSPSPTPVPIGSPYHHSSTSNSPVPAISSGGSTYQDVYQDMSVLNAASAPQDAYANQMTMASHHHHHHTSPKMMTSSQWSPLTPPSV